MKKAIVYLNGYEDPLELAEYFSNLGYAPRIVDSRSRLLADLVSGNYDKAFLDVNKLSDILLMRQVRSLCPSLEIVIIIKPPLTEVISILQSGDYKTVGDITNLQHKDII
jgi:hypothetical protein